MLWNVLRGKRTGVKFVRQFAVSPYIADFAARAEKLIVELDGDSHGGRERYDGIRTAFLEAKGYRVLRFTNTDVIGKIEGVTCAILLAQGRDPASPSAPTPPSPRPSPPEGGEGGTLP